MALVLRQLLAEATPPGVFWNVNLPSLLPGDPEPRVIHCPLEIAPLPLSFRATDEHLHYDGKYHERGRSAGSDVDICFAGNIAVTRLSVG